MNALLAKLKGCRGEKVKGSIHATLLFTSSPFLPCGPAGNPTIRTK